MEFKSATMADFFCQYSNKFHWHDFCNIKCGFVYPIKTRRIIHFVKMNIN